MMKSFGLFGFIVFLCLVRPLETKAHVHGAAQLQVVHRDKAVLVEWKAPAYDLLGFESSPQSPEQKRKWTELENRLESLKALILWPLRAECQSKDNGKMSQEELQDGHGDIKVVWNFECQKPEALGWIEIHLSKAFPQLQEFRVVTINDHGQTLDQLGARRQRAQFAR
jgi:hypothetical protein